MIRQIFLLALCSLFTHAAFAEWQVVTHTDVDTDQQTRVAYTENRQGYSLEIYRDGKGAIRSRFSMNKNTNRLAEKNCPTFQVDSRGMRNRSINDAPCISHRQWVEFVLGYIDDDQEVVSTPLHNMMNGLAITYRFILENGAYAGTRFSLEGSKRALIEVLGNQLVVRTEQGFIAN